MHRNWYNVMHIIYRNVYSLLKLISTRAPFVVVLDDQECVWRHFRSNYHGGELSGGGTLAHPSLDDPYVRSQFYVIVIIFDLPNVNEYMTVR